MVVFHDICVIIIDVAVNTVVVVNDVVAVAVVVVVVVVVVLLSKQLFDVISTILSCFKSA